MESSGKKQDSRRMKYLDKDVPCLENPKRRSALQGTYENKRRWDLNFKSTCSLQGFKPMFIMHFEKWLSFVSFISQEQWGRGSRRRKVFQAVGTADAGVQCTSLRERGVQTDPMVGASDGSGGGRTADDEACHFYYKVHERDVYENYVLSILAVLLNDSDYEWY